MVSFPCSLLGLFFTFFSVLCSHQFFVWFLHVQPQDGKIDPGTLLFPPCSVGITLLFMEVEWQSSVFVGPSPFFHKFFSTPFHGTIFPAPPFYAATNLKNFSTLLS